MKWTLLLAFALFGCASATETDVISVGFENHAPGQAYDRPTQDKDWTLLKNPTRMDADHAVISDQERASGQQSLQITYPAGLQSVKQTEWAIPARRSNYLSYRVKFASDFVFNGAGGKNGGKLPGLAGQPSNETKGLCTGGDACEIGNGFSARLMWRTDGAAVLYLYDLEKTRNGRRYGEDIAFANGARFKPGQWHQIEQLVTLNKPGQADGHIRLWMDGDLVVDLRNREIIGDQEAVDTVLFSTFFGGNDPNWFPRDPQTAWFDDFTVTPNRETAISLSNRDPS